MMTGTRTVMAVRVRGKKMVEITVFRRLNRSHDLSTLGKVLWWCSQFASALVSIHALSLKLIGINILQNYSRKILSKRLPE
jgi:hypothetical protein